MGGLWRLSRRGSISRITRLSWLGARKAARHGGRRSHRMQLRAHVTHVIEGNGGRGTGEGIPIEELRRSNGAVPGRNGRDDGFQQVQRGEQGAACHNPSKLREWDFIVADEMMELKGEEGNDGVRPGHKR